jgi:hypothetical protein
MLTADCMSASSITYFSTEYHNFRQNMMILFWKYLAAVRSEARLNLFWEYINRKLFTVYFREAEDRVLHILAGMSLVRILP